MSLLLGKLVDHDLFKAYQAKRDAESPEQLKLYWGNQTMGKVLQMPLPWEPPGG